MRRRAFIWALGSTAAAATAAAWPLATHAQPLARPARIGFLRAAEPPPPTLIALRRGLAEHGYQEGKSFTLVPGWGDGRVDRLPELANALVTAGIDIIVTDGTQTARAARNATATIPIVMAGGNDPIQAGLAASLARPGGNVTGFTTQVIELTGKMFELLTEILPGLMRVGVINQRGVGAAFRAEEAKVARALRLDLKYFEISSPAAEDFDKAIRSASEQAQAAIIRGSPFLSLPERKLIIERAAAYRLPTMCETRDFVELGGLASYGSDFNELFRLAAGYIVRILNGSKAGELPIEQANKFELVINLKTAKALRLDVPPIMLTRADEVIE